MDRMMHLRGVKPLRNSRLNIVLDKGQALQFYSEVSSEEQTPKTTQTPKLPKIERKQSNSQTNTPTRDEPTSFFVFPQTPDSMCSDILPLMSSHLSYFLYLNVNFLPEEKTALSNRSRNSLILKKDLEDSKQDDKTPTKSSGSIDSPLAKKRVLSLKQSRFNKEPLTAETGCTDDSEFTKEESTPIKSIGGTNGFDREKKVIKISKRVSTKHATQNSQTLSSHEVLKKNHDFLDELAMRKIKDDQTRAHPFRHLVFSPQINENAFKKHLLITYKGLVYAKKCLKKPSEAYVNSRKVTVSPQDPGKSSTL
jgi:hypothetical protein